MTKLSADWERIELDYRAGVKSVREIAAQHQVSHTAIQKRAKLGEWTRDLEAKIKAKADAKVAKAAVATEVATQTAATERQVVDANAEAIANVKLAHRADIRRGRALCVQLLAELEGVTERRDLVEQMKYALAGGDDTALTLINSTLDRIVAIPGRASTLKTLADALKSLVGLERQAWGLDERGGAGDGGWEALLAEIGL